MKILYFILPISLLFAGCTQNQRSESDRRVDYSESTTTEGVPSSDPIEYSSDYSNPEKDIREVLNDIDRVQSFYNAVQQVNLDSYIDEGEAFTIFAPTDSAFQDFYSKYPNIAKDNSKLQQLVLHHIASLYTNTDDMKDAMNFESLQGENIDIRIDAEQVYANAAQIVEENIMADNGVIHIIDEVMVPDQITQQ